jgi:hypothetical protein
MRLLVLADNDDITWAGPSQPVDLVASCGDVYDPLILAAAKACSASQILAVKGNHDLPSPFAPPITDLHLRVVTLPNGLRVGGQKERKRRCQELCLTDGCLACGGRPPSEGMGACLQRQPPRYAAGWPPDMLRSYLRPGQG